MRASWLQVVALVGTLMVGIVALALIVSQTPWFRDWLRRYIVRESKQYLNGELSIGGIGGNLLFGVEVSDIAVDVSGERVVAVKGSRSTTASSSSSRRASSSTRSSWSSRRCTLERDGDGWNLARLVKKQEKEADREGAAQADLAAVDRDRRRPRDHRRQRRRRPAIGCRSSIDDLDLKASFAYAPVHYTVVIDRVSLRAVRAAAGAAPADRQARGPRGQPVRREDVDPDGRERADDRRRRRAVPEDAGREGHDDRQRSRCRRSAASFPARGGLRAPSDVRRQGDRAGRPPGARSRRAVARPATCAAR